LQISDIHGSLRGAELAGEKARTIGADVVLVVGDITNFGTVKEAENILTTIADRSDVRVIFVPGNCDPPQLLTYTPANPSLVNIHGKSFRVSGLDFVGLGGSKTTPHKGTWIEFQEEEIYRILTGAVREKGEKWVLVTHNPPSGVEASMTPNGLDLGSPTIREVVMREAPMLVCCGHVHEARSISYIKLVPVINAGPAKDGYCAVIELSEDHAEAKLDTF